MIANPKIRLLTRYVDDILVIHDRITTNENRILNDINSNGMHNKTIFNDEEEISYTINYLDIPKKNIYKRK